MPDLLNWLFVFLRVGALLAIFPIFSATNFPAQIRVALGALIAFLVAPVLPPSDLAGADIWKIVGLMAGEVGFGLLMGFASRMIFYALEMAGGIIGAEMGLTIPASLNPMSNSQTTEAGTILHYLAAMLFLSLNLHHALLVAFQRSYQFLPVGGGHLRESLLLDVIARTAHLFWFGVQISAPVLAVSFLVTLIFAVLGRAVPQMNVFFESFTVRVLVGMIVFGLTCQLMGQHIANFLGRLPEDILRIAQLLGAR